MVLHLVRGLIISLALTIAAPWAALGNDDLVTDAVALTEAVDSHTVSVAAGDGSFSFAIAVSVVWKAGGNREHVAFPVTIPIALSGAGASWASADPPAVEVTGYGRRIVTITGTVPLGTAAGEYSLNARGDAPQVANLDNGNPVHLRIDWAGTATGATGSGSTDTTAPSIAPVLSGTAGTNGWFTSDVAVTWTVSDPESAVVSTMGCDGITLSASGSVTCSATSGGGTASVTVPVRIDQLAPAVAFGGNAAMYDVDQAIAITCTAADEPGGSGLASWTCPGAAGPAYAFGLGSTTLGGTAADIAGNTGSTATSFTVHVTATGLCNLTRSFAARPLGSSLCAQLNAAAAAKARGDLRAAGNATAAYVRELQAQTGRAFTPQQQQILTGLVAGL